MLNVLNDLLAAIPGAMERTYLGIIASLDQAETLANNGVAEGHVNASDALAIGEVKQLFIENFAGANIVHTLEGMRGRAEQETRQGQAGLEEDDES